MKTRNECNSFLATSSRKFFKYGLGLSIFLAIVAFKIPVYSGIPDIPPHQEDEIIEITYTTTVVPIKKIVEPPKKVEKPKTIPPIIKTVSNTAKVEPQVVKKDPPVLEANNTKVIVKEPAIPKKKKVWEVVEKMPEFVGGEEALYKYFAKEIQYNAQALEWGISGKVFVRFVVNKKGEIDNVEIAQGVDPLLDKEALRVVKNMPDWLPGVQNGENVNVSIVVPINFVIK